MFVCTLNNFAYTFIAGFIVGGVDMEIIKIKEMAGMK